MKQCEAKFKLATTEALVQAAELRRLALALKAEAAEDRANVSHVIPEAGTHARRRDCENAPQIS